jgi:outer membrane biosynthesis protein TonB
MVKNLRPSRSSAINGYRSPSGKRAGEYGRWGEVSRPLLLSLLFHALALGGLIVVAPYVSAPPPILPPAQMVQLVDLPAGGGRDGTTRETLQPTPKKPPPPAEPVKTEAPAVPAPPESKPEKVEKPPPPKPKEPAREPAMVLPTSKPKEPPKKEPPKREDKKPEPAPRIVAEKPPEVKF